MSIPAFLPYFVLAGTAAAIAAILYGLNSSLLRAHWPAQERRRAGLIAGIMLIGWLAAAIALGGAGVYHVAADGIPTIQYGIFIPIAVGLLLLWRSALMSRILDAVPQPWLVGVQLYRALGVIFLILYAMGKLPGLFAWPAGVGDIAVGLAAPVVALAYARAPHENAGLVGAWNLFGIFDLIVAVTMGFATAPSALRLIDVQPTSELMTVLPMVLIPTFLVPLSIVLHVASLKKLPRDAAKRYPREPVPEGTA
jgi:hypothetical protein